jgi:hypothetical protein
MLRSGARRFHGRKMSTKPLRFAVLGEIEHVEIEGLPRYLRAECRYSEDGLIITIEPARLEGPTKSSQSAGVDIDAVHRRYAGAKS